MRWLSDEALDRLRDPEPEPPLPPEAPAATPEIPGGRYAIREEIGRGGMGVVYLAHDRDLDREVAVKVLLPGQSAGLTARLLREARILALLEHPGIVPVHDVGTLADGRVYYAMRRVRGAHLDDFARTAPLDAVLGVFERVLDAVAFAHARGVIHRDLKPENVLVGAFGDVQVMDWGVAKSLAEPAMAADLAESGAGGTGGAGTTLHGTVLGTPGFMPPEQERGEVAQVDERADVYALGKMLDALLPREAPRPLRGICERATAPWPEDRYPGVRELGEDLRRYLNGLAVGAYREGWGERTARLARIYKVPLLLVLAYLAMRLILLWVFHR